MGGEISKDGSKLQFTQEIEPASCLVPLLTSNPPAVFRGGGLTVEASSDQAFA